MPREKLEKLFSLDIHDKEESETFGLGILITRRLVNIMGGTLRATTPSPISTDPATPGMQFSFAITCFSDHISDKILDYSSIVSFSDINVLIITSGMCQTQYMTDFLNLKGIQSDIFIYDNDSAELLINKLIIDRNRYQMVVIATAVSELTFAIAEEIHQKDLTDHCLYVLVDACCLKGNYLKAKSLDMDYYFVDTDDLSRYDPIWTTHFTNLTAEGIAKTDRLRKDLQILIADNNALGQAVSSIIFRNIGYEVDHASNALELVKRLNHKTYDVIFIDLKIPPNDGFEVAEMLRTKKYETPIIAMTSTLTKENIKRIVECGMNGFLPKPLFPDNIKQILTNWFS
jgi:CheY-like chemotaxis protein